jgi:hypothetical protein
MNVVKLNAGFFSVLFQLRFLYVVRDFMRPTVMTTMIMAIMVTGNKLTNSVVSIFCEHFVLL